MIIGIVNADVFHLVADLFGGSADLQHEWNQCQVQLQWLYGQRRLQWCADDPGHQEWLPGVLHGRGDA